MSLKHKDQDGLHQKGKSSSHTDHSTPSPGQHSTAPRGPLTLQFLQRERVQGGHPAPQHCQSLPRRPNFRSHLKGELCSLTTGDQIMTEMGNGVYGNHIWILEDWVSTHSSIQVESQWFCLSAESRLWPSLTRNLVGHRSTWFGTTNNEWAIPALEPVQSLCLGRTANS